MTQHSSLASVHATRLRLEELGLSTKKHLGQHYLIDDGIVGKIIRLASVAAGSRMVEVGPGIGTLTEALLAQGADLTAVEIDSALCEGLASRYPAVHLVDGDALDPRTVALLQGLEPVALVANLPYAVAATIILLYFQELESLQSATVMVQREVADRITAQPGGKDYGAYTVKLQLLARVEGRFAVQRQSFYPPPRVDSAVVRLERECVFDDLSAHASTLADAAFYHRRKTIRNSMQAYFKAHDLDEIVVDHLLTHAGINPGIRGEALSPDDYLAMAEELDKGDGGF